jgi:hypothetical protein
VPFLPPQVWLGYRHLEPESRWRVWNGTCAQAHCSIFDMAAGRACLSLDCPTVTAAVCMFNEERDHKQQAYVSSLRKCMPRSAVPDACLAAI